MAIVSRMVDADVEWDYLISTFLIISDKHAHFRSFKINSKDNPWFAEIIHTC